MRSANKEARIILEKYSVDSAPVRVEEIAQAEGAQIARHHFEGSESGFILRDGKRIIIGVNTRTSLRRQRFTIAHEIGHLLLHDGKPIIIDHAVRVDWRDDRSSLATDDQEIEANAFAAELLMPSSLIFEHLESYVKGIREDGEPISRDDLIAELARTFNVSAEAMGYRLINLAILAT
jgi:Zn-dependent peptidase ImmA (M78 family)